MDFHDSDFADDFSSDTNLLEDFEWSSKTSSSSPPNVFALDGLDIDDSIFARHKLKPSYLTLLFGADAEQRINDQPFKSNRDSKSKYETNTTLSYYDFPPTEEANLRAAIDPNTTHLTVAIADYDDCYILQVVQKLVSKTLSSSLASVQLYIRFSNSPDFQLCAVHCLSLFYLLESFKSVYQLQHLTMVVEHELFSTIFAKNASNLDLVFLGRLTELYFSTFEDLSLTPLLHWLAKSSQQYFFFSLQVLALGNPDNGYTLGDFVGRFPVLGKALIELPGITWFTVPSLAIQSFNLMPHLVHVSLKAHSTVHFFEMLAATAQLANLQSMAVTLNTSSPETGHCPLYQFAFDPGALPRFPLLKSLKLVANVHSHGDLQSSLWASVFPNLEHLELEHNCNRCKICPPRSSGTQLCKRAQTKIAKIVEECLFHPFKQCPKLNSILAKKNNKWAQSYVLTKVNGLKVPLKMN